MANTSHINWQTDINLDFDQAILVVEQDGEYDMIVVFCFEGKYYVDCPLERMKADLFNVNDYDRLAVIECSTLSRV